MILKHLDKNNMHHAYLIEGARDEIVPEILSFLKDLGVETIGNPDFIQMSFDSFKMDDARNLKSYGSQKGFSVNKKIFVVSVNNFLLEAQNSLLKMFEEPIENTHFFLIVPDIHALLKTFISRFYLISDKKGLEKETQIAENFIAMSLPKRIDFIKELLVEPEEEDEEGNEIIILNSTRAQALKFLNALEFVIHGKLAKQNSLQVCHEHIFKVREYLRMPGSSAKSLMESVALLVPEKI